MQKKTTQNSERKFIRQELDAYPQIFDNYICVFFKGESENWAYNLEIHQQTRECHLYSHSPNCYSDVDYTDKLNEWIASRYLGLNS